MNNNEGNENQNRNKKSNKSVINNNNVDSQLEDEIEYSGDNDEDGNKKYKSESSQVSNFHDNYDEVEDDENSTEREAVELLKSQHREIKHLKRKIKEKEKVIKELNLKLNDLKIKVKDENDDKQLCTNLKKQIDLLNEEKNELKIELNNKDKLIYDLKNNLNNLTEKFNEIKSNIKLETNNNEKIKGLLELVEQYTKEIKNNEKKIKLYEKELQNVNKNLKTEMKKRQKFELLFNDKIKDDNNLVSIINKDISLICNWIKNYMGIYFDKKIEIPEVPRFTDPINYQNNQINNRYNFDELRSVLWNTRCQIWNKQSSYEENIQQFKREQIDLIRKIEIMNENIEKLNRNNLCLKEVLYSKNIDPNIICKN